MSNLMPVTNNRGADVCVEAVGFEPGRTVWDRVKLLSILRKARQKRWRLARSFSSIVVSLRTNTGNRYSNFSAHCIKRGQGNGLVLYKKIAGNHHGNINISSGENEGCP